MESNAGKNEEQLSNPGFHLLQTTEVAPEVTGGSDLLQHFALRTHYDALQKQPPPEYVAQSGYLKKPVGDTALRRGEGMQLGQLLDPNWSGMASETTSIAPLGLEALRGAFTFRGEEPIELAQEDLGAPTYTPPVLETKRPKDESNGKKGEDKKKKKHKSKHKDRDKDRDKSKEKDGGSHKKDKKKKRKEREGEESNDRHKSKKSKHSVGAS